MFAERCSIHSEKRAVLEVGVYLVQAGMDPALHHQGLRSFSFYLGCLMGSPGKTQRSTTQKIANAHPTLAVRQGCIFRCQRYSEIHALSGAKYQDSYPQKIYDLTSSRTPLAPMYICREQSAQHQLSGGKSSSNTANHTVLMLKSLNLQLS